MKVMQKDNNHWFGVYFESLHPLLLRKGFTCDTTDIDSNEKRIKIVFKTKSPLLSDTVSIELNAFPLKPHILHLVCFTPFPSEVVDILFNLWTESLQSIANRFEKQFVARVIQILSFNINVLPQELCLKIIEYLPLSSVIQLSQTNNYWYDCCGRDSVWVNLFMKRFPHLRYLRVKNEIAEGNDWRMAFKREYIKVKHFGEQKSQVMRQTEFVMEELRLRFGQIRRTNSV